jgi:PHD/YefM family antitoxin component YafN of YafNO toxin-antitoxin module
MKTIEITTASQSLAECTKDIDQDFVVLTSNHKPVAAIVSLKDIDPESHALSTNPQFMKIVEQARREFAAGNTVPLDQMKQQCGP